MLIGYSGAKWREIRESRAGEESALSGPFWGIEDGLNSRLSTGHEACANLDTSGPMHADDTALQRSPLLGSLTLRLAQLYLLRT